MEYEADEEPSEPEVLDGAETSERFEGGFHEHLDEFRVEEESDAKKPCGGAEQELISDNSEAKPEDSFDVPEHDVEEFEPAEPRQEFDTGPSQAPLTVTQLAGKLTNLVWWARNPKLKGRTLSKGQKEAKQWLEIFKSEILPALHHASAETRVAQLIFFASHPEVQGRFKQLTKPEQEKFRKLFLDIRDREVRPWLKVRIARGKPNSRTIFLVNNAVFNNLPLRTRTRLGAELVQQFAFVGQKESAAPVIVIVLEPDRFPESYNFSDAVVSLTHRRTSAHVELAMRQQKKNAPARFASSA